MFGYRVPAPDEAMLISGGKRSGGAPFRVVIGHGAYVMPWFRRVRFLTLAMQESVVQEQCVTTQGIGVNVSAVIAFKVPSDEPSVIAAGQRFLGDQRQMPTLTGQIFAGHLRSIVGAMTMESIITKRQELAEQVVDASKVEMARLGLLVDSFQITHVDDAGSGYIAAMAAPHNAAIQQAAKVAQAEADRAAAEAQQNSTRQQAEYQRDTALKQAGYKAEVDKANAEAAQAGPLAEAQAQQAVIDMQREQAQRQAALREQQLVAEVQRPAEAEARRVQIAAQAEAGKMKIDSEAQAARDVTLAGAKAQQTELEAAANAKATELIGAADASKIKATKLAEAEGAKANADAMAANDRAQLEQARINIMPEVARALGSGLAGANLTVLNGADGLTDLVASVMQQGRMIMNAFKDQVSETPVEQNPNGEIEMSPAAGEMQRR